MALFGKEDLRPIEQDLPTLADDGLIVRMRACGVCGSDLRQYYAGPSKRYRLPIILGHEVSAEVIEIGPSIEGYNEGDLVTLAPIVPCMRCRACSIGMDNLCENGGVLGTTIPGGFAEMIHIPSQYVRAGGIVKVPEGVDFRAAALNELVGCCVHGLRQMDMEAGDQVLIVGDGPIGLTFLQLVKQQGAGYVVTTGRRPTRRQLASELGTDEALNADEVDLRKEFSRRFDRVIIATSNVSAAQEALDLVRPGGDLLLFSGYKAGTELSFDINALHYQELHIHGSIDCTIVDFRKASALMPQLQLDRLITHTFPLDEIQSAFEAGRHEQDAVKVMIVDEGD